MANIKTGRKEAIYTILDSCADRDYVGIDLAQRLGLDMEQKEMEFVAFVDATSWGLRNTASLNLGNLSGSYQLEIHDVIIRNLQQGKMRFPQQESHGRNSITSRT